MNLIITPVYKSYEIVKEMCEAIDKNSIMPFLHILVDDDSDCGEFPVKASPSRRILMLKRDYSGVIHKNGGGQAIQVGYDYAQQAFCNEQPNPLPYDNVFLIEADVIVEPEWDKKMIDLIPTLPLDWLTLDQQSIDEQGNVGYPTTISVRLGMERDDLEIMKYPDFQVTLFNPKIFDSGVKFSDFSSHFDISYGDKTAEVLKGRHFRTKTVKSLHYFFQSRKFLSEIPKE